MPQNHNCVPRDMGPSVPQSLLLLLLPGIGSQEKNNTSGRGREGREGGRVVVFFSRVLSVAERFSWECQSECVSALLSPLGKPKHGTADRGNGDDFCRWKI